MTCYESRRINGAKKYPYLNEMHPEDRADYLAGKYTQKDKVRFLCDICGKYYTQPIWSHKDRHLHLSCSYKQRGIAQLGIPKKANAPTVRREFICQTCGEAYITKTSRFSANPNCGTCTKKIRKKVKSRKDYPFMNEIREDYQVKISNGEISSKDKVPFICSIHGEYWQELNNHNQGQGCMRCGKIKTIISRRRKEYDCVAEMREDYQAKIANGEINSYDKVPFICEIHGEYWQELNNHNKGQGCPMCNMGQTPYSFLTFLQTLQTEIKPFDRQQIKPLEIDFYLPEYSLGFEFNDIATHQTLFARQEVSPKNYGGKPIDYHYKKWQMAKEKGITLMHVWDVDWQDDVRREKIKSIIISLLRGEKVAEINKNTMRFYECKPRAVIERSPKNFIEMRDKCINGEAARFYTCGIMI